jgi:hypothetical protein
VTGILAKYRFPGNDGCRSWYFGAKDVFAGYDWERAAKDGIEHVPIELYFLKTGT